MIDISVFKHAPQPVAAGTDKQTAELVEWFRSTYPEREDIKDEDLNRAARDYVLIYC